MAWERTVRGEVSDSETSDDSEEPHESTLLSTFIAAHIPDLVQTRHDYSNELSRIRTDRAAEIEHISTRFLAAVRSLQPNCSSLQLVGPEGSAVAVNEYTGPDGGPSVVPETPDVVADSSITLYDSNAERLRELEALNECLIDQAATLTQELDVVVSKVAALGAQLSDAQVSIATESAQREKELGRKKAAEAALMRAVASATSNIAEMRAEVKAKDDELAGLAKTLSEVQAQLEAEIVAKNQLDALRRDLEDERLQYQVQSK